MDEASRLLDAEDIRGSRAAERAAERAAVGFYVTNVPAAEHCNGRLLKSSNF